MRLHTNPLLSDTATLGVNGYRYVLEEDGPVDDQGQQCCRFRVENVTLAPTLDYRPNGGVWLPTAASSSAPTAATSSPTGASAGAPASTRSAISIAMLPADDPAGRTILHTFRTRAARYPVGGIKETVDGVIRVEPTDFIPTCYAPPAVDSGLPRRRPLSHPVPGAPRRIDEPSRSRRRSTQLRASWVDCSWRRWPPAASRVRSGGLPPR